MPPARTVQRSLRSHAGDSADQTSFTLSAAGRRRISMRRAAAGPAATFRLR
jgi:hypothetical protein